MASPVPERVAWAVDRLAATPARRVLEIGCGPGHAVGLICARLPSAVVTAIDRSARQAARARANCRPAIERGRARVEQLTLVAAPAALGSGAFDAVLAVNVNAFWTAPAPSLASLARLLAAGGRAVLVYEPPSASGVGILRERLSVILGGHGFVVAEAHETAFRASHGLCILARAAAGRPTVGPPSPHPPPP